MNVKMVRVKIEEIRSITWDNETAHIEQDRLYTSVLESIAKNPRGAQRLAQEALKVQDIEFTRWYA